MPGTTPKRFGHFAGRDVLALPAEGVADAIDEIEIAQLVAPHQIAGAEPAVALLEHVAQNLLLRVGRLVVAVEVAARFVR